MGRNGRKGRSPGARSIDDPIDGIHEAALEALEHLALGVVLVDRNGRPVHLNRSAEELVSAGDGLSLVD